MRLSIIIPVFNEEKTIVSVVEKVSKLNIPSTEKEIIVVDDTSTDSTPDKILNLAKRFKKIKFLKHSLNMGKGAAVITGIKKASGDYIIIQDADLEYNPTDIIKLVSNVKENRSVIYGTRLARLPNLKNEEKNFRFLSHYLGNRFLSFMTSVLYGQWITDMETCYKLFPKVAIKNMRLRAKGFEFEPEITAKLLKKGYKIYEVPIKAKPRGYSEGKKLQTIRDGYKAVAALVRYKFKD